MMLLKIWIVGLAALFTFDLLIKTLLHSSWRTPCREGYVLIRTWGEYVCVQGYLP